MFEEMTVQVRVAGQHPEQDGAVTGHLDDFGNRRVGVLVADNEERMLTNVNARGRVFDAAVGETARVDTLEVNPQVPVGHGRQFTTARDWAGEE